MFNKKNLGELSHKFLSLFHKKSDEKSNQKPDGFNSDIVKRMSDPSYDPLQDLENPKQFIEDIKRLSGLKNESLSEDDILFYSERIAKEYPSMALIIQEKCNHSLMKKVSELISEVEKLSDTRPMIIASIEAGIMSHPSVTNELKFNYRWRNYATTKIDRYEHLGLEFAKFIKKEFGLTDTQLENFEVKAEFHTPYVISNYNEFIEEINRIRDLETE